MNLVRHDISTVFETGLRKRVILSRGNSLLLNPTETFPTQTRTSAVTQRLVIQFSKLGHFAFKGLGVPIKTKMANYLVILGFYSLLTLR